MNKKCSNMALVSLRWIDTGLRGKKAFLDTCYIHSGNFLGFFLPNCLIEGLLTAAGKVGRKK